MNWSDPIEFFAMGGYGVYVWGSMGAVIIAVHIEYLFLRQRRKAALRKIERQQNAEKEAAQ